MASGGQFAVSPDTSGGVTVAEAMVPLWVNRTRLVSAGAVYPDVVSAVRTPDPSTEAPCMTTGEPPEPDAPSLASRLSNRATPLPPRAASSV
mgnify:FL=1|jgi:hypothetical protein